MDKINIDVVSTANSKVGLSTLIQSSTINFLRSYFKALKTDTVSYAPNITRQDIAILGDFPRKQVKYPSIVVSIPDTANLYQKLIGRDLYKPLYKLDANGKKILVGYEVGGIFTSMFNISVACESTAERRDLLDYIAIVLRAIAPQYLHKNHIDISNIQLTGVREELIGNDLVYWDTLSISVHTEWKQIIHNLPLVTEVKVEEVTPIEGKI